MKLGDMMSKTVELKCTKSRRNNSSDRDTPNKCELP